METRGAEAVAAAAAGEAAAWRAAAEAGERAVVAAADGLTNWVGAGRCQMSLAMSLDTIELKNQGFKTRFHHVAGNICQTLEVGGRT